ncbi:site-2 protease family protein [Bacillus timonensis]|nr:site-2 protease family protein [Bacillus timonensis]
MENFLAFSLEDIPYVVAVLLIAFTVHEFAHAYVAYKFGDMTAKNQGRLTLSPLAHLDPLGTILLLIAGFGWAKPVPVNRFFFKKPRLAGVLVAFAGPLSNLLLAGLSIFLLFISIRFGLIQTLPHNMQDIFFRFFDLFVHINVLLFIFNLLPFPPLDGYRIIEDLMPNNIRAKMTQYESFGIVIFILLVITPLDQYTIQPIFTTSIPFVIDVLDSLFRPILPM